jgi:hypothetical protein
MNTNNQFPSTGARRIFNSTLPGLRRGGTGRVRVSLALSVLTIAALLSACTASAGAASPTATSVPSSVLMPTSIPVTMPTSTAMPAGAGAIQAPAVQVQLDPCVLLPVDEASALAGGAAFAAGTEETLDSGVRICHYGANTANVLTVEVGQAQDATAAQQFQDQFIADMQANAQQLAGGGLNVTQVSFADSAVLAQLSTSVQGVAINGSAFGFRKGTVFFGFSDLVQAGPAPTSDALQAEANTVFARLP